MFKEMKPGTQQCQMLCAAAGFLLGLLLTTLGLLKTLIIAAFALLGYLIGHSKDLKADTGKLVRKVMPQKDEKVVYTKEDLEKVKAMLKEEQQKEAVETQDDTAQ